MSVLTRSLTHAQVISAAGHRFHLVQPLLAQLATSSCSRDLWRRRCLRRLGRVDPRRLRAPPVRKGIRASRWDTSRPGGGRACAARETLAVIVVGLEEHDIQKLWLLVWTGGTTLS